MAILMPFDEDPISVTHMAGSVDLMMMPKFSTSQIRIGAMMLKHFPRSSPNRNGAHREGDIMPATIGAITLLDEGNR
jgi:hypothetical protein